MLSADGIHLRHIRASDLDTLWPLLNRLSTRGPYLPMQMQPYRKFIERYEKDGFSSTDFERLVLLDDDQTIIGTLMHFKGVPYMSAREIGYNLFDPERRSKGTMSAAVRLLVDYLFKSFEVNRLEIRMHVDHIASERVAQKCGFTREALCRGASFVNGQYQDMYLYALLRQEWQAAQRT